MKKIIGIHSAPHGRFINGWNLADYLSISLFAGLAAHRLTVNPVLDITQKVLTTLSDKRNQIARDDIFVGRSIEQKQKTLMIELSGANDMITINTSPSYRDTDLAIEGRV